MTISLTKMKKGPEGPFFMPFLPATLVFNAFLPQTLAIALLGIYVGLSLRVT
jgi:hypothetical protein